MLSEMLGSGEVVVVEEVAPEVVEVTSWIQRAVRWCGPGQ